MRKPSISVIIPALNEEKYLPRLLESLLVQSDTDFEVIVIDGRSKDKTVKKAKEYEGKISAYKVIIADHASLPYQRNIGAKHAISEWLLFVDADSTLLPYAIERVRANINKRDIQFFSTWNKPDTDSDNDAIIANFYNLLFDGSKTIKIPVGSGPFTGVRRDIFEKVNGYDEEHPFLEDADLRNRLGKAGVSFTVIRETLFVWSLRRMRKQGIIRMMQAYAKALIPFLFFKTIPKGLKGYDMGGHVFRTQKKPKISLLRSTEKKIRKLLNEVFE